MDGNSYRTHGNGREQARKLREGRRTMEKVLENTVRDISGKRDWRPGWDQSPVEWVLEDRQPTSGVVRWTKKWQKHRKRLKPQV